MCKLLTIQKTIWDFLAHLFFTLPLVEQAIPQNHKCQSHLTADQQCPTNRKGYLNIQTWLVMDKNLPSSVFWALGSHKNLSFLSCISWIAFSKNTFPERYTVGMGVLDQVHVESSTYYTSIFLKATVSISSKALKTLARKKYVILLNVAFS